MVRMVFQFDTISISMVRIVIRIIRMVMSCQNGFLAGWIVICMAFWMVKIVLKMVKWISNPVSRSLFRRSPNLNSFCLY